MCSWPKGFLAYRIKKAPSCKRTKPINASFTTCYIVLWHLIQPLPAYMIPITAEYSVPSYLFCLRECSAGNLEVIFRLLLLIPAPTIPARCNVGTAVLLSSSSSFIFWYIIKPAISFCQEMTGFFPLLYCNLKHSFFLIKCLHRDNCLSFFLGCHHSFGGYGRHRRLIRSVSNFTACCITGKECLYAKTPACF